MAFKSFYSDYQRPLLGIASVIGMLLLWEIAFTYVIPLNPFFFTKPSLIAMAFKEQFVSGSLWHDLAVSSQAFLLGFSLAVVVGIPVGVFTIVSAFILTGIYVYRANGEFDELNRQILEESK